MRILIVLINLFLISCSHSNKDIYYELKLRGQKGDKEVHEYLYRSAKKTVNEEKVGIKTEEKVKFKTAVEALGPASRTVQSGAVTYKVKTIEKEGEVELNDLAFPELNESMEFDLDPQANVHRATGYAPGSIFYVQQIPLPEIPVKIGETWALQHRWLTKENNIPLQLDVIGILKEVMPCGFHDECADIEVSGEVSMPKDVLRAKFKSRVKGRILLALKRGMVVWSDIRTTESISTPNERVEVETCMVSRLLEPEKYDLKNLTETECKPIFNTDIKVPTPKFYRN